MQEEIIAPATTENVRIEIHEPDFSSANDQPTTSASTDNDNSEYRPDEPMPDNTG